MGEEQIGIKPGEKVRELGLRRRIQTATLGERDERRERGEKKKKKSKIKGWCYHGITKHGNNASFIHLKGRS